MDRPAQVRRDLLSSSKIDSDRDFANLVGHLSSWPPMHQSLGVIVNADKIGMGPSSCRRDFWDGRHNETQAEFLFAAGDSIEPRRIINFVKLMGKNYVERMKSPTWEKSQH